jgi:uncharacterized membrane protein YozB (DUF420 family)
MNEILHAPGFLGTTANFAADVTLLIMLTTAILFSIGFYLARQDNIKAHKWVQTIGAIINLIMVLWLMVLPFRDFIVRDQGGPREGIFYAMTIAHAVAGLAATVFGLFVVLRGHKLMPKFLSFNNYKPFMRWAYGLYITATTLGVFVYIVWFVVTANTPTYG